MMEITSIETEIEDISSESDKYGHNVVRKMVVTYE